MVIGYRLSKHFSHPQTWIQDLESKRDDVSAQAAFIPDKVKC